MSFIVDHFCSVRSYIEISSITFETFEQVQEYIATLPEFAMVGVYREDKSLMFRTYPNPYNWQEKDAAEAFEAGDANWRNLMP